MPIYSIFNKSEQTFVMWAIFFDPLQIFNRVGMPMVEAVNNMHLMEHKDEALAAMATNKDLVDRLPKR